MNDLVKGMGRALDPELDTIVAKLMKRAADTAGFLGDEANRAIAAMCNHCTRQRMLTSSSWPAARVPAIRTKAAGHIEHCVRQMGTGITMSRDIDKVIQAAIRFVREADQQARHAGRRLLYQLMHVGAIDERHLRRLLHERAPGSHG